MCIPAKAVGGRRVYKYNAVAERLAKARMQRAMASMVRVNLNNYWDLLEPTANSVGFVGSSWRQRLAAVINESGRDQRAMINTKNNDQPAKVEDMETEPEK